MAEEGKPAGKKKLVVVKTFNIDEDLTKKFKELMEDLSIDVRRDFYKRNLEFFVKPRAPGIHPAVIVIHDWWGINEYIKETCMRLAKQGYVVLAPSLYDGETTNRRDIARYEMMQLDNRKVTQIIKNAFIQLDGLPYVDSNKIGVIGYLMGGYHALLAASEIKELACCICVYGRYSGLLAKHLADIHCPVLFVAGGIDYRDKQQEIQLLLEECRKLDVVIEDACYPNVRQDFFDDHHIETYDHIASEDAWRRMARFLRNYIKYEEPTRYPVLRRWFGKSWNQFLDRIEKSNSIIRRKILDTIEDAFSDE